MTRDTVTVRIRYLSTVRENTGGMHQDDVRLPAGQHPHVGGGMAAEKLRHGSPGPALMTTINGYGWNQVPGGLETVLSEGDEIALFPLLTGG